MHTYGRSDTFNRKSNIEVTEVSQENEFVRPVISSDYN